MAAILQPMFLNQISWKKINEFEIKHDDVIKWKHFPRNWSFVEFTGHRWIPSTKASDAEL